VSRRLATFALSLVPLQHVRTSGSRERPQRHAFTRGLGFVYTRRIELHRAGLLADQSSSSSPLKFLAVTWSRKCGSVESWLVVHEAEYIKPLYRSAPVSIAPFDDHTSNRSANPIEDQDDWSVYRPATFTIGRTTSHRYNITYCFKLLLRFESNGVI